MNRSVLQITSGLRAVALAAILGGQTACVRGIPVQTMPPGNAGAVSAFGATAARSASASVRTSGSDPVEAPSVVVRDYWRAQSATVVAWNKDESWQGLRAAVMRDGTIALDHILYYSAYAAPNPSAFRNANWYAFSDTAVTGKQLMQTGMLADRFNCQGKKGCSPYVTYRARVSEELLRSSHDSLVVQVVSQNGYETVITLRGTLISSYLATVDSLSAARKAKSKAANQ